jgi:hypothetical protein
LIGRERARYVEVFVYSVPLPMNGHARRTAWYAQCSWFFRTFPGGDTMSSIHHAQRGPHHYGVGHPLNPIMEKMISRTRAERRTSVAVTAVALVIAAVLMLALVQILFVVP